MKQYTATEKEVMQMLGKVRNCVTVRRAVRFIQEQPSDADIVITDTTDYHYSSRRNRSPLYAAEIIAAQGEGANHGYFTWSLAYKPEKK
jgi:hypothetical protein